MSRTEKMLNVLEQMTVILGTYGSVIYAMADPAHKQAMLDEVGKLDDMLDILIEEVRR